MYQNDTRIARLARLYVVHIDAVRNPRGVVFHAHEFVLCRSIVVASAQ